MIDHPNIYMRWGDSAEKRRWMRSLAMLLQVIEDSDILKTDRDREGLQTHAGTAQEGVRVRAPHVAGSQLPLSLIVVVGLYD
jgi:hypothetical protein